MLKTITTAATLALAAFALSPAAIAADGQTDHSKMNHQKMEGVTTAQAQMDHGTKNNEAAPSVSQATGTGVINSIDAAKKHVNLKHNPIPELGWPEMTMDLRVSSKVDLGKIKAGDKVTFRLKLGRDKTYRIIEMEAAK